MSPRGEPEPAQEADEKAQIDQANTVVAQFVEEEENNA